MKLNEFVVKLSKYISDEKIVDLILKKMDEEVLSSRDICQTSKTPMITFQL
jgi:hypothetical protein